MPDRKKLLLIAIYALATIQFAWCYLWLTRPYVNTYLYEQGLAAMPFQGRCLMVLPMRLAHNSLLLQSLSGPLSHLRFWFPKPVQPEVLAQAAFSIVCIAVTGILTTKLYAESSRARLLTPLIYPLVLAVCAATYVLHTVQNFRFIYDFPSLAFFSVAMYLIYFKRHWAWFAVLFVVATVNRETTLLLLPLYLIDQAVEQGKLHPMLLVRGKALLRVLPLAAFWVIWQIFVRHLFAHNPSEFYPRLDWNVKSILAPQAWPQLLSACGYLLLLVILMRRRIADPRLRAWFWLIPMWTGFMFVFGILIETRVFGELIPFVVCSAALILEEVLLERVWRPALVPEDEPEEIEVTRAA